MSKEQDTTNEKQKKPKVKYATSEDCIHCANQCTRGKNYLAKFRPGKIFMGVVCERE